LAASGTRYAGEEYSVHAAAAGSFVRAAPAPPLFVAAAPAGVVAADGVGGRGSRDRKD
jgi:hypothetical protein